MNKEAPNDLQKQNAIMIAGYAKMHAALEATRRPIIFSLCQYGRDDVWTWGASVGGNLWRTTGDIRDNYKRMADIGFNQIGMAKYAGPGHWNDPDMLEIGNGGMSFDEEKTHMSLWAILAAPLIAGNDLSHMSPETLSILTNREVIAVDQDRLGHQGTRADAKGATEIWTKPLTGGAVAVGLFNRDTASHEMTLNLKAFGFGPHAKLRDLWAHTDVMPTSGQYTVNVPPHGVVMLRVSH
jgi:alpha-galactosidase